MKKIFILAYARRNLGDDLFIEMLLKRYPQVSFYINVENPEHATLFKKFPNITVINEKERNLTKQNADEYDGYIYVGGSIFMEGGVVYNITDEFLDFLNPQTAGNNKPAVLHIPAEHHSPDISLLFFPPYGRRPLL